MTTYNLSQIMKDAHSLRRNSPERFSTFSQALKASWSMAKFRKQIEANRAETIAYHEAKKEKRKKSQPEPLVLMLSVPKD